MTWVMLFYRQAIFRCYNCYRKWDRYIKKVLLKSGARVTRRSIGEYTEAVGEGGGGIISFRRLTSWEGIPNGGLGVTGQWTDARRRSTVLQKALDSQGERVLPLAQAAM